MSESELRRRIEAAILGRDAIVAARAVIDELGLEVETRAVSAQGNGEHGYFNPDAAKNMGPIGEYIAALPVESRVVGRWEEA